MIDTDEIRNEPAWICTRTGDELTKYCHEDGCALAYYPQETVLGLCDEIDRLRAIMQLAIDFMSDDENRDEMSSDAQEWCNDAISILNGAF